MSRRPAAPDRSEQNRATLKQLVKLESNKSCADCKRNKHPRWASWNIGVFVCIRCSGVHRSLGVHISRVKSVDLDSWTDEQMASMLRWGNARANKYWEAKLAEGHVPNESKIENFIRTKYDSKRWVMDGPMPDPSTLDDGTGDDDVPLNVVQEKAKMERSGSLRNGGPSAGLSQPPRARPQQMDLFGDEPAPAPVRPNTTVPSVSRAAAAQKAPVAPPKQTRPGESLLGLDFFGGTQSAPPRPSSAASGMSTPGTSGRTDLKNSILSLYASAPKPAAQQPQQTSNAGLFGGMTSPSVASPPQQQMNNTQSLAGLGDAFGSLSFASPSQTQPQPPKSVPFSDFSAAGPPRRTSALSGGNFFETKPAPPPKPTSPPSMPTSAPRKASIGFGDFGDFSSGPTPQVTTRAPPVASSGMGDLFDMGGPPPPSKTTTAPAPAPASIKAPSFPSASAFNLSQPAPPKPAPPAQTSTSSFSTMGNMDAWGSSDAWATPDPPSNPAPPAQTSTSTYKTPAAPATSNMQTAFDGGWGDPEPTPVRTQAASQPSMSSGVVNVQQDEEFGGWSHASPVATTSGPKQGGLGGNSDDLFGNVWE